MKGIGARLCDYADVGASVAFWPSRVTPGLRIMSLDRVGVGDAGGLRPTGGSRNRRAVHHVAVCISAPDLHALSVDADVGSIAHLAGDARRQSGGLGVIAAGQGDIPDGGVGWIGSGFGHFAGARERTCNDDYLCFGTGNESRAKA